jgi:hypothetical protein
MLIDPSVYPYSFTVTGFIADFTFSIVLGLISFNP